MPLWTVMAPLALAGAWEDLAPVATGSPDFAVTCSSAQTAWAAMGRLLGTIDEAMPTGGVPADLPWAGGSALFDPDSRLAVRFASDEGALSVRFTTGATGEEIARRFAGLAAEGERVAVLGADGWEVRALGGEVWRVTALDGWVAVDRADKPAGAGPGLPPSLRPAMPDPGDGCLAWVHLEGKAPLGTIDIAAEIPLQRARSIHFAVAGDALRPLEGVFFNPQPPIEVRSTRHPDGIVVLGVGLDGIDFSRVLRGRELRKVRALQRLLPITTGSVLAVVPGKDEPSIAMVFPVAGGTRAAPLARRLRRALAGMDIRAEAIDATHLVVDLQGSVFHVATTDGRLVLSDDLPLLYDITNNVGDVWIDAELAARAARYPLALSFSVLPTAGAPLRVDPPFSLALDLVGGVVRGEMVVPLTLSQLVALGRETAEKLRPAGPPSPGGSGDSVEGEDVGEGPLEDPRSGDDPRP